jgi:hypothetical protein
MSTGISNKAWREVSDYESVKYILMTERQEKSTLKETKTMLTPKEFLKDVMIHSAFQDSIIDWLKPWRMKTYVDILIVVDEEISITPTDSFGIASVIDLLRTTTVGCMHFRVDIALRNDFDEVFSVTANPLPTEPKYRGFRFNSIDNGTDVIDKYEQIWCFGFKPNNFGSNNDAEIDEPYAMPATNAELEKLDEWMTKRKGGLFGTGDHHFLGASMCRKIPRLGTMRRWTNADGVPPQFGPDRIDTLRPPSPVDDYRAGGPRFLSNTPHQGDLTVQPIKWKRWCSIYWPFSFPKSRPHPVLCHPTLGPINVMPDHAHEGLCVPNPDLSATKQFNRELEYPDHIAGGNKPEPEIIAWGSNLDSDDWNFDIRKGEQPGRSRNPMIAVYDGHQAGVGRVATDSTWHHWMDVNINAIKAANNDDWKKISRYFINLAVWLNPPGFSTRCFYLSVVASHFEYVGFQEYSPKASKLALGHSLRTHLAFLYGPCWVTDIIWLLPLELNLFKPEELRKIAKRFSELEINPEYFEELVLGHMVEVTMAEAESIKRRERKIQPLAEPEKLFEKAFRQAVSSFNQEMEGKLKNEQEIIKNFKVNR